MRRLHTDDARQMAGDQAGSLSQGPGAVGAGALTLDSSRASEAQVATAVEAGVSAAERHMRLVGAAVRDDVLAAQERAITAAEVRGCVVLTSCGDDVRWSVWRVVRVVRVVRVLSRFAWAMARHVALC